MAELGSRTIRGVASPIAFTVPWKMKPERRTRSTNDDSGCAPAVEETAEIRSRTQRRFVTTSKPGRLAIMALRRNLSTLDHGCEVRMQFSQQTPTQTPPQC